MKPYLERAADVTQQSFVSAMVLLSPDNTDVEIWPFGLDPACLTTEREYVARQLRPVAVMGISAKGPHCAIKEPLAPNVLHGIAAAFMAYIGVLLSADLVSAAAECAELERLMALPDPRPN